MKMSKEKRDRGVSTKVNKEGTKRFWVIFASYATLLFTACILVLIFTDVHSVNKHSDTVVSSMGQWLRPSPKDNLPQNWHNLLVKESENYTSTLTNLLFSNVSISSPCFGVSTTTTKLEGLPKSADGKVFFQTDIVHHLTLVAYDENGEKRCAGGDYYEVDFHNDYYRSRLPTVDFGNGSYGLELLVPSRFAGAFTLEIFLLYGNWHGMELDTGPWVNQGSVLVLELEMRVEDGHHHKTKEPFIKQCTQADFNRTTWKGRWTRSWFNGNCAAEQWTKRFRCLPEEHYWCEEPWCFGPVGRLEGNGWHYSAHCSFKIFQPEEALKCLDGRWFMMWGDSNFQDTIRNLLLFIMEWNLPPSENLADFQLSRTYEMGFTDFTDAHRYDLLFRVSSLFNGANREKGNGEGLNTLRHQEHQDRLVAHFNGNKWPDTIIMNSGLHDGSAFPTIQAYSEAADFTIDFWKKIYKSIPADRKPQLIWRATVAPAGIGRAYPGNPMKMEMFNLVMAEKLQRVKDELPVKFVDAFDLTFPFHYSNEFSDGGHYGRAPGVNLWPWLRNPHWYFVDIMLAHILLNAICPST